MANHMFGYGFDAVIRSPGALIALLRKFISFLIHQGFSEQPLFVVNGFEGYSAWLQ